MADKSSMAMRSIPANLFGILLISFFAGGRLHAQDLTKEVYVVSSYRPEIADADKLSTMPEITDTFSFETKIDYTVLPSRIRSDYSLRPIKPAKMVGTPLDKLYKSHLKVGLGNYSTPLIEYSIHNLRSKEYAYGGYIFHKSSYAKLELDGGAEVPANYSKNNLALYGKKFYRNFNLEAEVGGRRNSFLAYGLNEDYITIDTVDGFYVDKKDIRNRYNKVYAKAGIHSTRADSSRVDYRLFVTGDYFWDREKSKEPHVQVDGNIRFPVRTFNLSLDGRLDYYNLKDTLDQDQTLIYTFRPVFSKRKDQWSVKVGGRLSVLHHDTTNTLYLYPDVDFRFKIINNFLGAFFGVTGYLEHYSFESLSLMNPYMLTGQHVRRTNHPYIFYAGIEGYLTRKAGYRFNINYEAISGMAFFVNYQGEVNYWNEFRVVTDDPDRLTLHLEMMWDPLKELGLLLKTNYYSYTMYGEEYPWHMPNFDLTFTTRYNFREKVYAELDFITLGKRYASSMDNNGVRSPAGELDPIYDLNLKLSYKYSDILSFFLHGYNLINQHYYFWNQYRSQGFNLIGGLSYKF